MRNQVRKNLIEYLGITIGSLIVALGLDIFQIPNKIAAGGLSGLATVAHYVFGFKVGLVMLALDIPLFLAGLKNIGWRFGIKTLYGFLTLALFIDSLASYVPIPTQNMLLASLYGGIVIGAGLGIVFYFGGSTGGTDTIALLIHKYFKVSIGKGLLIIDGFVIALAAYVFGLEQGLYSLISLFVAAKVIDLIQEGEGFAKLALIITPYHKEIADTILREMDRGVTYLTGKGAYSGEEKDVIMVVFSRNEVSRIKEIVASIDKKAFMVITTANEALGEGFKEIIKDK
jgi:uncharacterized membrane-anchored protein YitT (DUF2179 family)